MYQKLYEKPKVIIIDGVYMKFYSEMEPVCLETNASKSFSSAETKYGNTNREALGIIYSLDKFHNDCFAHMVSMITNHKLLVVTHGRQETSGMNLNINTGETCTDIPEYMMAEEVRHAMQ